MNQSTLLDRLDAIAESVKNTQDALAFLALGSVGKETSRIDEFSDLDFFVICKPDKKDRFIHHVDWLTAVKPAAFFFQNTRDGLKFIYEDGILCEFAIFTEEEFSSAQYSEGRFLWKAPSFHAVETTVRKKPLYLTSSEDYLLGEAITNLYVGMGRYLRGEKLSAFSFVQNYAFHHVLTLIALKHPSEKPFEDVFNLERRFETRFGAYAQDLSKMMQGYERTPESAEAILTYLVTNYTLKPAMVSLIEELIYRSRK